MPQLANLPTWKQDDMHYKSLKLIVPDEEPYDQNETWFETLVATDLRDVFSKESITRFWFTRYGAVGSEKHALFRIETDDEQSIKDLVNALLKKFPSERNEYTDYDFSQDIGRGENSRFLGQNSNQKDNHARGKTAFEFLHSAARLFIDCLDGPDEKGYWRLEPETHSGFSVKTSMEQFHHLFCNMTGVPTFVAITNHPSIPRHQVMSYESFKGVHNQDNNWKLIKLVEIQI